MRTIGKRWIRASWPVTAVSAAAILTGGGVAFGGAAGSEAVAQSTGEGKPGLPTIKFQPVEDEGSKLVSMSLLSERTALVPGERSWLAVRFLIQPDWHLYWRNPGESGLPPTVRFEAPEGVRIGEAVFPVPDKRYRLPTGGVDYIFENELTLLFPVEVSSSASMGPSTITAEASWLVCRELCLAGDGESSLSIEIAGESSPSGEAKAFDVVRRSVPREATGADGVDARWDGDTLIVEVEGADRLTLYPYKTRAFAGPVGIWERGSVEGDRLAIPFEGDLDGVEAIGGVVEVRRAGGETERLEIRVPRP